MQVRKVLVMTLVVLATSAFLLPFMVSAASWSSPFALATGGIKPAVAVDANGNQYYVWWNNSGSIQFSKCTGLGGNGCSSPEDLPTNGASFYPSIALDPQGRPNVVFESKVNDSAKYAVFWTRRQNSGWTNPQRLTNEPYAELADIAIGPGGTIHVVYQSKQGDTGYVYYTKSVGGTQFSAPEMLDSAQSNAPIAEFGKLAAEGNAIEGTQLANGLYPRVAADQNDNAHVVWNLPGPTYGIKYARQVNGSFVTAQTVGSGQKDQTPDVTVAPNGAVGIIWGTYDDFNAAFAEYDNGVKDNYVNDIDGGLAQSLWPKIGVDCAGNFHFVFQGSVNADSQWNIYYRPYNPSTNQLGRRQTIANLGASEQTPAVDARSVVAVVYTNVTNGIIDAATANLNLDCGGATPTPSNTPTATSTPDPNITPTATPTPGAEIWIPNAASCPSYDGTDQNCIHYRKAWKKYNNGSATDGNYSRCEKDGVCQSRSAAKIIVPDGYTQVQWYTAKALSYGIAKIWINDQLAGTIDLCKGSTSLKPKFVNLTYTIPDRSDGLPRSFEIGAPGKHTNCSPYDANFVVIDGYRILP